jgi:hypothetical protein
VPDVLPRAPEARDAEESWTNQERQAWSSHVEQGFLQAERGELIDGNQARSEIQKVKEPCGRTMRPACRSCCGKPELGGSLRRRGNLEIGRRYCGASRR